MKNLLPKKRYSTTFGVDPCRLGEQKNVAWHKQRFNAVLKWWEYADSNCGPLACHASALTN